MPHLIAPSMLACNFANIDSEVEMINRSLADWIHLDIMDGNFVPNISFGFPVIKAIRKSAKKPLDVHLMIIKPELYIEEFKKAGADILTVHYEASTHLHRTLQSIRNAGMQAGVALNPHSSIDLIADFIQYIDLLLIMSVNPGFGGQSFIKSTYTKVIKAKKIISDKGVQTKIEVDGGVNLNNIGALLEAGADVLVAGNFIFRSENPESTIDLLKNCANKEV